MKIPFSKVPLAGNELQYVTEVLKSGWLTTSSKAQQFEQNFADLIGARYACAVNSCTSALHLAIEALHLNKGDQVLVPSLTFTASAEILRYMGIDPVFMDVEYSTGLITPQILLNALRQNSKIKALILVHYGGQAAIMHTEDQNGIIDICKKSGIKVVEDAAHAFPTKFENKYVGSFGDITCFSFYANKTITTGEGGMLVTNDEQIYQRVKVMRLHGINRDIWTRFTDNKASWEYDVVAPGYKYNMPDINAAVGLAQLEKAEYFRKERQRCAEFYFKNLMSIDEIDLPVCSGPLEHHSWHLFPIKIKPCAAITRNEFITQMGESGIGTSVHYKPLHRMTYYREMYFLKPEAFPETEKIWERTVSLPIYPELSKEALHYIYNTILKLIKNKISVS